MAALKRVKSPISQPSNSPKPKTAELKLSNVARWNQYATHQKFVKMHTHRIAGMSAAMHSKNLEQVYSKKLEQEDATRQLRGIVRRLY
jgi:hypothetical protein